MDTMMRAAYVDRYGGPGSIRIVDAPMPLPGRGEVIVRVEAAAVTSGDARLRSGRFPRGFALPARLAIGIRGPRRRIPGSVFSGRIVSLGPDAGDVATGEAVAGMAGTRLGAHAQYRPFPLTLLLPYRRA